MRLDIHERDVDSTLCQACAGCCRVTFKLRDTTSRYRRFLRQIGYALRPPAAPDAADCCAQRHDVTADMGWCRHLVIEDGPGGGSYRCTVHGTPALPELCAQFNCVGWAKANDTYRESNALLARAQQALDRLRARRGNGRSS